MNNPYKKCPVFQTDHFIFRLVKPEDADDLLKCYSDPKAQEFFNTDNFPHDCRFNTINEMLNCIEFWLTEYSQEKYIRFAVVEKSIDKAVGTIEMFGGDVGVLRIDIVSAYEEVSYLDEIIEMCIKNFYDLFAVSAIATKAIPEAENRIESLLKAGFNRNDFKGREHYYLRSN